MPRNDCYLPLGTRPLIDTENQQAAASGGDDRRTVKADAPHDPIHDEKTQVVNTKGK